jgi:hypothetical protein
MPDTSCGAFSLILASRAVAMAAEKSARQCSWVLSRSFGRCPPAFCLPAAARRTRTDNVPLTKNKFSSHNTAHIHTHTHKRPSSLSHAVNKYSVVLFMASPRLQRPPLLPRCMAMLYIQISFSCFWISKHNSIHAAPAVRRAFRCRLPS